MFPLLGIAQAMETQTSYYTTMYITLYIMLYVFAFASIITSAIYFWYMRDSIAIIISNCSKIKKKNINNNP